MQLPMFTPECDWRPPSLSDLPSWADAQRIGIDVETCDPTLKKLGIGVRRGGYMVGVSFAIDGGPKFYLPFRHQGGDNLDEHGVLGYLRDNARAFTGQLVGARLSYDLDYLWSEDIKTPNVKFYRDIQNADPLIDELQYSYSLDNIAKRRGFEGKNEDMLREAASAYGVDPKGGLWQLPARYVGAYGEDDAELPLLVLKEQEKLIEKEGLWQIWNLESQVLPVLVKMRQRGVRIDLDKLEQIEEWSVDQEREALDVIKRDTGIHVALGDVWKADALAPALEAIGVRLNKTSQGKPNIDKEVLKSIKHPVADAIAWARKTNKLRTTFAQSIRTHMVNGRIHCTFNQMAREDEKGNQKGARYGRLSAVDPNLQQQPSRDEFADMWRSIYIPEEDAFWGCNDYCFSDDTEVLTENGFKLFKDLDKTEQLASFDENRNVYYTKPKEYQCFDYDGEMIGVGGRFIDLNMTPNHNCMLMNKEGELKIIKASDYDSVGQSKYRWQPNCAFLKGGQSIDEKEIVASVAAQADGSWRGGTYRLWTSKERKMERLRNNVNIKNEYLCEKKGNQTAFVFSSNQTPLVIPGFEKILNREAILQLPIDQRRFFINELLFWDGSGTIGKGAYYSTTEPRNAEIVHEIAILSGYRSNKSSWQPKGNKKLCHVVTFSNTDKTSISNVPVSSTHYKGKICCVTMPIHHAIIVRRNGKVVLSSQSQQEPRWTTHFAAVMELPKAKAVAKQYRDDHTTDNHDFMTNLVHGVKRGEIPDAKFNKLRSPCKDIFLGLCYGEGGAKLCGDLGLPTRWALNVGGRGRRLEYFEHQHEAMARRMELDGEGFMWKAAGEEGQAIIDKFNTEVPYVGKLAKEAEKRAKARGYVTTVLGRKLHFPTRNDGSYDWVYRALNRVIQGSSADQMKQAMVDIDREMPDTFLQLQVHDETDGSFGTEAECLQVADLMRNCVTDTEVPFLVDTEMGPSWGEIK